MDKDEEACRSTNEESTAPKPLLVKIELHPAFYVATWIFFSSSVILFNKWILDTVGFPFPIFLTTWHLLFATLATQLLARTTTLLDGIKTAQMNGKTYLRKVVPIGVFFSLSLICSNQAYLYLSVAFIQMLKATTPLAVLLATWMMRGEQPDMKVLGNVMVIVLGIIIASYGEIAFVFVGFIFQVCGIAFESIRLVMVQILLSSSGCEMDPLVSLYYFAPVCMIMNAICCCVVEGSKLSLRAILDVGLVTLFMNAGIAFCLNVAVVSLIGKTSSLVLTLSGVLKDILLVVLSVIIWSTPVTMLQAFGYTIALAGLIYYKVGGAQVQAAYGRLLSGNIISIRQVRFPVLPSLLGRDIQIGKRKYLFVLGFLMTITTIIMFASMRHIRVMSQAISEMREHPIEELIRTSRLHFEKTLMKQSRTLAEAVQEYRTRTGMYPPPKFDIWYEFAKANDVQLIDEFDTINDMLRPFWGVPPAIIRKSIRDALGAEGSCLHGILIRNGTATEARFEWDIRKGKGDWKTKHFSSMIEKFVHHLPDMDVLLNGLDEPTLVIPHDILDHFVKTAQKHQQHGIPHNFFSKPSPDMDEIRQHYGNDYLQVGHAIAWNQKTQSCPFDSPARQLDGTDLTSKFAYSPLGFIYNTTAFSNVCDQPSLRYHHGFFDRPANFVLFSSLLPIFSTAKPSSFNDILIPSLVIYNGQLRLDEQRDVDWNLKKAQLHWRGSDTTGYLTPGGFMRHQRQRFVKAMDRIESPVPILKKVGNAWVQDLMSPGDAQELFDVKFTRLGSIGMPEAFEAEKKEFDVAQYENQQELWKWKYLLDIDGMGLSGRYTSLLKSNSLVFKCAIFREWHDKWLWPWLHYVPLGLNGTDWFEAVRFFVQEEIGDVLGEMMAKESHIWANKVLRNVDMEVWMFRLLLEYARVLDDQRDIIGFKFN